MTVKASQIHKLAEELDNLRAKLEDFKNDKEETLENAQDSEHPNESRIEALEEQYQQAKKQRDNLI